MLRARQSFKKQVAQLDAHVRRIELAIDEPCAAEKLELTRQALITAAKRLMEVVARIDQQLEARDGRSLVAIPSRDIEDGSAAA
jgi:hypothetical protein